MHDTPMDTNNMEAAIAKGLAGAKVSVSNPSGDGMHFVGEVYWAGFAGKSRIEQHRLVYAALEELFAQGLHGLKLTTGVE
jgi:stress-induced morphogen